MLNALKFVNRATADKDIVRILTHICVHDGLLQGADTRMSIAADCPELAGTHSQSLLRNSSGLSSHARVIQPSFVRMMAR